MLRPSRPALSGVRSGALSALSGVKSGALVARSDVQSGAKVGGNDVKSGAKAEPNDVRSGVAAPRRKSKNLRARSTLSETSERIASKFNSTLIRRSPSPCCAHAARGQRTDEAAEPPS